MQVEELYYFICSKYEKLEKKIEHKKPIIITQNNFKGKFYDIIILIPIPNTDYFDSVFVQIGLNKKYTEISTLQKDIATNHHKYKNGIEKYINVNISNIYLHFIFDKQTQENCITNNESGSIYCLKNKIQFHLFSLEDNQLYNMDDNFNFQKASFFEYKPKKKNILGK